MNKWLKKGILVLAVGCLTFGATGCQADQIMDKVLEKTDPEPEETVEEDTQETKQEEVDVAKPEFTKNLEGKVEYKPGSKAKALEVEA